MRRSLIKAISNVLEFFALLPTRLARLVLGVVVLSAFLAFVYAYSPAGPTVREWVREAGSGLPTAGPQAPGGQDPQSNAPAEPAPDPAAPGPTVPAPESWTATTPATIDREELAGLDVTQPSADTPYERDAFGPAWQDVDRNGCGTRDDILKRDLADETFKPGTRDCVVLTGTLADPYTGTTIAFNKQAGSTVDIDHLIPLGAAWEMGASEWTDEQRLAYANDPEVLLAVDAAANRGKGDKTISEWVPANDDAHCAYAAGYVHIAAKYSLSISREDYQVITQIAGKCA